MKEIVAWSACEELHKLIMQVFPGVAKGGAYFAKPLDNVLSIIFPVARGGSTTESAMEVCFLNHFQETQWMAGGEVQSIAAWNLMVHFISSIELFSLAYKN